MNLRSLILEMVKLRLEIVNLAVEQTAASQETVLKTKGYIAANINQKVDVRFVVDDTN